MDDALARRFVWSESLIDDRLQCCDIRGINPIMVPLTPPRTRDASIIFSGVFEASLTSLLRKNDQASVGLLLQASRQPFAQTAGVSQDQPGARLIIFAERFCFAQPRLFFDLPFDFIKPLAEALFIIQFSASLQAF